MEAKLRLEDATRVILTRHLVKETVPAIKDLVEGAIGARFLDSCFDALTKKSSKADKAEIDKVLEEMAQNVSESEENAKALTEKLKNKEDFDQDVCALIVNYYTTLSRALKVSYESIKNQYHLKYEV